MTNSSLDSFQLGVLAALKSIQIASEQPGGFDTDAMKTMANHLKNNTQGVEDQYMFSLPLNQLIQDDATSHEEMLSIAKNNVPE